MRNLIDDKYNREYKLDRRTRAKAIEILNDYYKQNKNEANVSALWLFKTALLIIQIVMSFIAYYHAALIRLF